MADVPYEGEGFVPFRLRELATQVRDLQKWQAEVDRARAAEAVEQQTLVTEMASLRAAMDGLRGMLVKFALTLAGSAVVFAFSILVATGKI